MSRLIINLVKVKFEIYLEHDHWGETGLANSGVSLSKMDAPKVGKSVFCSFEVFYHNFRANHSSTVFI